MNRRQREQNRANAAMLASNARSLRLAAHVCDNCGESGGHWISTRGTSLAGLIAGVDDQQGFWTCPNLYGPDGRRLQEHTNRRWSEPADALGMFALLVSEAMRSNVRVKPAPTVGRQARTGENVPRTARPGLVARRWGSA